jgi:uncharacterized membrane protein YfhO
MEGKEFDYRKTLVLEKNPGDVKLPSIKDSISFPKSTVQITDYKNDKISIDVESSENGFLYLSELYYPAWKAFIDGKDAEIYRTDFCMRSVYIMQGKHKVEFIYDSTEYKSGKKISIFMLVFTFISLVFLIVKGRVKVKTKSADENIS